MTAVMLLGAGHGTRLRPLTDECPKALVPIGDRPVIAHQIECLRAMLGEPAIIVNAHHLAGKLLTFLDTYDPSVRVIVESTLLGTAGGLHGALKYLDRGPLLVANVDVISTVNYREILDIVTEQSMVLAVAPQPTGRGTVGLDNLGRIVRLRSEVFGVEFAGGDYLGVAAIGSDLLPRLPDRGCLVEDFMLPLLRTGATIGSYVERTRWLDIGTVSTYALANFDWLREKSEDVWTASETKISGRIDLQNAIVGRGAQVDGQGLLERVIIWPLAHVDAPLSNAIVTSAGIIVPISTG